MTTSVHPKVRRRGPVRRFLEARGVLGGHRAAHALVRLTAADGTRLAATYLPGPGVAAPAVVLLHGFGANRRKPAYAALADALSRTSHVLSLDLRGHGESGGTCTLGDLEVLDVDAAIDWLRRFGHPWVALVGVSMGATAALHAAATRSRPDAVAIVSAAARFREVPETAPMQRLHDIWVTPWKRHGLRAAIGVRLVAPALWVPPEHPEDLARQVDVPLLVVHGADDPYFPLGDAEDLAAAGSSGVLWAEPDGFGHAEDGLQPGFATALARAILVAQRTGRFPSREEVR